MRPHPAQRTDGPPIIVREKLGAPRQFSALSPFLANILGSDWRLVEEGREVANRLLFVSEGGREAGKERETQIRFLSFSISQRSSANEGGGKYSKCKRWNSSRLTTRSIKVGDARSVKMASLAFERSRRSRELSRPTLMMDRNGASKWRKRRRRKAVSAFSAPFCPISSEKSLFPIS